ncbi:MAG TPA: hypothetical protein VK974_01280 [Methylophilaceae bacterium]|nr:hypothetical protein [Methylophilaceae bacterium]
MDNLPLTPNLIQALDAIKNGLAVPIPKKDIQTLIDGNWIAARQPGWALNSKGRALMRRIEPQSKSGKPTKYKDSF